MSIDSPASILYDAAGNPVAVVLDGSIHRLAVDAKITGGEDPSMVVLDGDYGQKVKPTGARGFGGWIPEPTAYPTGPDGYKTGTLQIDPDGSLLIRGPVLTDERSFRCDFPGTSLHTVLTGTLTFTNGNSTVTGNGTTFSSELSAEDYIRLLADGYQYYTLVKNVISDTELLLVDPYVGSSGSGVGQKTLFTITGTQFFTVVNSKVTIPSGTTASQFNGIYRMADYSPIMAHAVINISTRQANQYGSFGLIDTINTLVPSSVSAVVFDGTDATKVKFNTSCDGVTEQTDVILPLGYTTANELDYQISVYPEEAVLSIEGVSVARHKRHIPNPYVVLNVFAGWYNLNPGPVVSSNMLIDLIFVSNHNRLQVSQTFLGDTLPVRIVEDVHSIVAKRTTTAVTEVSLIEYTVPVNKTLWVVGYCVSAGISTIRGYPVKIGKGWPLPDPTNPGVVDGGLIRSFLLEQKTNVSESFSVPLYLAAGGETVYISITPDGVTSTIWRAQLDFILR